MGNFEKLSVLVIVVIIVMILVVALYTWTDKPEENPAASSSTEIGTSLTNGERGRFPDPARDPWPDPDPSVVVTPPLPTPPKPDPDPDPEPVRPLITPDPAPVPEPEQDDEPWSLKVAQGDTLSEIAQKHLGTMRRWREIVQLNPGLSPTLLRAGMTLKMPPRQSRKAPEPRIGTQPARAGASDPVPGSYYVIQGGDKLTGISKRAYGTIERWPEIFAKNVALIREPSDLPAGTRIFIPE